MNSNLLCPVDGVQINEIKVRLIAGFVLLTALLTVYTGWLIFPAWLVADFSLRSFERGKYSPFGRLSDWLIKLFRLPYKPTDQAPKRFAARIGLGFSILIFSLQVAGISTLIPVSVLATFAALESLAGFCAGCYVFTFYTRLFTRAS